MVDTMKSKVLNMPTYTIEVSRFQRPLQTIHSELDEPKRITLTIADFGNGVSHVLKDFRELRSELVP